MLRALESWLWYVFIFSLPFQTVWLFFEPMREGVKWQYGSWGIYASDGVLLALLVALLWRWISRKLNSPLRDTPPQLRGGCANTDGTISSPVSCCLPFIILFLLWSSFSALWVLDPFTALRTFGLYVLGMGAFLAARYAKYSLRMTVFVFVVSMSIHAIIGIGQFFAQYSPPITVLGMAEYDPWMPGVSVLKLEGERWLRAYGGFPHPNIFGGALVMALFGAVWMWLGEKRRVIRRGLSFAIIFLFGALLLTFSRTAWVGMALGVIVAGVYRLFQNTNTFPSVLQASLSQLKEGRMKFINIGMFLFIFFAVMGTFAVFQPLLFSRFDLSAIEHEASLSDRGALVEQAWRVIQEHPFIGVGAGNFTAYTSTYFREDFSHIADFQPVHNVPILLFAELGVVGFFLFVLAFLSLVWDMKKESRFIFFIVCAVFFPAFLLDHWLFTSHFGVVFVGALTGLFFRGSMQE